MSGRRLSPQESRALDDIERGLGEDPSFTHLIASECALFPSPGRHRDRRRSRGPTAVWCAALVSLALLVPAAATSAPPLIAAFALSYATTCGLLLALVRRWCRSVEGPENLKASGAIPSAGRHQSPLPSQQPTGAPAAAARGRAGTYGLSCCEPERGFRSGRTRDPGWILKPGLAPDAGRMRAGCGSCAAKAEGVPGDERSDDLLYKPAGVTHAGCRLSERRRSLEGAPLPCLRRADRSRRPSAPTHGTRPAGCPAVWAWAVPPGGSPRRAGRTIRPG
ncbi:DUF3040 domain-containing protein [Streptomyces vinaceus]|uniref:DUF3040 domain-containing protein n=1 Tax=Streptomyces vinaceus TaxID=1960 RepID=UPI0016774CA4